MIVYWVYCVSEACSESFKYFYVLLMIMMFKKIDITVKSCSILSLIYIIYIQATFFIFVSNMENYCLPYQRPSEEAGGLQIILKLPVF